MFVFDLIKLIISMIMIMIITFINNINSNHRQTINVKIISDDDDNDD